MEDDYMTVADLIELLSCFDPAMTVGVRASCCSHAHCIHEVRRNGVHDFIEEAQVIIDAAE